MNKTLFLQSVMEAFDKMNERDLNDISGKNISIVINDQKETNKKEPEVNYVSKALDFLYSKNYSTYHDDLFSFIVNAELGKYRFYEYQYARKEGNYVRETIMNVCELLDQGVRMAEIADQLNLKFDTVCYIRAFFKEEH